MLYILFKNFIKVIIEINEHQFAFTDKRKKEDLCKDIIELCAALKRPAKHSYHHSNMGLVLIRPNHHTKEKNKIHAAVTLSTGKNLKNKFLSHADAVIQIELHIITETSGRLKTIYHNPYLSLSEHKSKHQLAIKITEK